MLLRTIRRYISRQMLTKLLKRPILILLSCLIMNYLIWILLRDQKNLLLYRCLLLSGLFLETEFDSPRHHRQLHQWVNYYKCNHYLYHAQDSTSVIRYDDSAIAIRAATDGVRALNAENMFEWHQRVVRSLEIMNHSFSLLTQRPNIRRRYPRTEDRMSDYFSANMLIVSFSRVIYTVSFVLFINIVFIVLGRHSIKDFNSSSMWLARHRVMLR
ncbi:hypothetical protein Hanom_Chr04g00364201 [Helianthus anomalus]